MMMSTWLGLFFYMLDFLDLLLRALARIDARDVDDRFLGGVEHLQDIVGIRAGGEKIADVELLQIFITVQLFIVGVGDCIEFCFVVRSQHGLGIASEIGAGHCNDVHLVAGDELAEVQAELVGIS
jgi:hypothetical protein